jgi:hypothetical protein
MAVDDDTKDLSKRAVICHKLVSGKRALATICGRNEKPQQSATTH